MFILGLRDAFGLKVSLILILLWNVYFFAVLYAGNGWLSLALLAISLSATCYGSFQLCKHRDILIFSSKYASEHAFPSSPQNIRATFNMHLAAFMLFYCAPLLAVSVPPLQVALADNVPLLYAGFLFGIPGVVGVLHHFVRKVADRGST